MAESLTILTAPALTPVSVAEQKTHMRMLGDDGSHDGLIADLIAAATAMVEARIRQALIVRTYALRLDAWPVLCRYTAAWRPTVWLPMPPAIAVSSITYIDPNGAEQTLDPGSYQVDADHRPGRIDPACSTTWPSVRAQLSAVVITYTAGMVPRDASGDPIADPTEAQQRAAIPQDLRAAVKLLAAHLYENPEATTTLSLAEVPLAVQTILENHAMPLL